MTVPVYAGSRITLLPARPGSRIQEQCFPRILESHSWGYVVSPGHIGWHVNSGDPRDAWAQPFRGTR